MMNKIASMNACVETGSGWPLERCASRPKPVDKPLIPLPAFTLSTLLLADRLWFCEEFVYGQGVQEQE